MILKYIFEYFDLLNNIHPFTFIYKNGCCEHRGVMTHNSKTQTTVLSGKFHEPDVKKEFFDNIYLQKVSK